MSGLFAPNLRRDNPGATNSIPSLGAPASKRREGLTDSRMLAGASLADPLASDLVRTFAFPVPAVNTGRNLMHGPLPSGGAAAEFQQRRDIPKISLSSREHANPKEESWPPRRRDVSAVCS